MCVGMTDADPLQALRADHEALAGRVKRLEQATGEQRSAHERRMQAGFDGVNAKSDGIEAELRHRFEPLDRLEEGQAQLAAALRDLSAVIRGRLNDQGGGVVVRHDSSQNLDAMVATLRGRYERRPTERIIACIYHSMSERTCARNVSIGASPRPVSTCQKVQPLQASRP
jgi:hypothetical protein